jgi:hypothetical protein
MHHRFVFQVQGDEGYYPNIPGTTPPLVANYEARIINTMWNVSNLSFTGQPAFSRPDLAFERASGRRAAAPTFSKAVMSPPMVGRDADRAGDCSWGESRAT